MTPQRQLRKQQQGTPPLQPRRDGDFRPLELSIYAGPDNNLTPILPLFGDDHPDVTPPRPAHTASSNKNWDSASMALTNDRSYSSMSFHIPRRQPHERKGSGSGSVFSTPGTQATSISAAPLTPPQIPFKSRARSHTAPSTERMLERIASAMLEKERLQAEIDSVVERQSIYMGSSRPSTAHGPSDPFANNEFGSRACSRQSQRDCFLAAGADLEPMPSIPAMPAAALSFAERLSSDTRRPQTAPSRSTSSAAQQQQSQSFSSSTGRLNIVEQEQQQQQQQDKARALAAAAFNSHPTTMIAAAPLPLFRNNINNIDQVNRSSRATPRPLPHIPGQLQEESSERSSSSSPTPAARRTRERILTSISTGSSSSANNNARKIRLSSAPSAMMNMHEIDPMNPPLAPPLPLTMRPPLRKKKSFSRISTWLSQNYHHSPERKAHGREISRESVTNSPRPLTEQDGFYTCLSAASSSSSSYRHQQTGLPVRDDVSEMISSTSDEKIEEAVSSEEGEEWETGDEGVGSDDERTPTTVPTSATAATTLSSLAGSPALRQGESTPKVGGGGVERMATFGRGGSGSNLSNLSSVAAGNNQRVQQQQQQQTGPNGHRPQSVGVAF